MASSTDAWLKWIAGIVAVVAGLPVLFVYGLYWYGAKDLPKELPRASHAYPDDLRRVYWQVEHGARGKPAIRAHGPVSGFVEMLFADGHRPTPSMSLPGHATRLVLVPLHHGTQGQWHLRSWALSIRLSQERNADELIDLALDRSYFAGGVHGIDAAARANYGVPLDALSEPEALALIVTMKGPSAYSPHCNPRAFEARYQYGARQVGLRDVDALAAARRRLRPLPCEA